jgi:hypothetical protein
MHIGNSQRKHCLIVFTNVALCETTMCSMWKKEKSHG